MPELPDIIAYLSALEPRIIGQPLTHIRIASPFLLRTVQPTTEEAEGHKIRALRRIGKRIAIELDNGLWLECSQGKI
jgi:formamidopyrimidine-DNA glycosylase